MVGADRSPSFLDPEHSRTEPSTPEGSTEAPPERKPESRDLAVSILGHTPVGALRISATAKGIRTLSFVQAAHSAPTRLSRAGRASADATRALHHLREAEAVLRGYFAGVCTEWDLPLDLVVTEERIYRRAPGEE